MTLFRGSEMATYRIQQSAESSTLLKDETPIMVIEHRDMGAARARVRMILLDEAQARTGPGDVLELADSARSSVRERRSA